MSNVHGWFVLVMMTGTALLFGACGDGRQSVTPTSAPAVSAPAGAPVPHENTAVETAAAGTPARGSEGAQYFHPGAARQLRPAGERQYSGGQQDVEMTLDEVPAAVATTIRAKSSGYAIDRITYEDDESGGMVYVVIMSKDGREREFKVDAGGKFMYFE